MKKFFISFVLIISLLFNVFADNKQAHKELREVFENYGLLPELIEKGFSLDKLDEINDPVEMRDYLQPFFMDENGMPLDNHAQIYMEWDRKGWEYKFYNFETSSSQLIDWSDEYGSKDELLKKGYKEDEIFYYPYFNGEWKDGYRVGKKFMGVASGEMYYKDSYCVEGKNTTYCKLSDFGYSQEDFFNKISKSKKKYLVLDLCGNPGGKDETYFSLVKSIKKMNPKKIFLLINQNTLSMGDYCSLSIKKDINNEIILIGEPTNGAYQGVYLLPKELIFNNFSLTIKLGGIKWVPNVIEGIGVHPDIYTSNYKESIEVVKYLTKDYELNIE